MRNELRKYEQIFQNFRRHLKILGAVILRMSKSYTEDPQILGATLRSSVA